MWAIKYGGDFITETYSGIETNWIPQNRVKTFDTKEDAINYAAEHGLSTRIRDIVELY